jgi:hypothetical protein
MVRRNKNETKMRRKRGVVHANEGRRIEDDKSRKQQIEDIVKGKITAETRKVQG